MEKEIKFNIVADPEKSDGSELDPTIVSKVGKRFNNWLRNQGFEGTFRFDSNNLNFEVSILHPDGWNDQEVKKFSKKAMDKVFSIIYEEDR